MLYLHHFQERKPILPSKRCYYPTLVLAAVNTPSLWQILLEQSVIGPQDDSSAGSRGSRHSQLKPLAPGKGSCHGMEPAAAAAAARSGRHHPRAEAARKFARGLALPRRGLTRGSSSPGPSRGRRPRGRTRR